MVKRPVLGVLLLGLVAASLLAASGDASAVEIRQFELRPNEYLETQQGLAENWGRDTVLTEAAPDKNYKNEKFLNTSSVPGQRSQIVMRFPLDQAMRMNLSSDERTDPLPPNISVTTDGPTGATLRLYYRDSMDDDQKERTLDVHSLETPWEEGELDWDGAREKSNFVSPSPIATSPQTQPLQQPGFRSWDVTPYLAEVLSPLNPAPFFGFLIRDSTADGGENHCDKATVDCVQKFYSSNWLTDGNRPGGCAARSTAQGGCIPELLITARMNEPQAQNISYDGGFKGDYVAPDVPLNVSVDVWDRAGEIEEINLDLHHKNGTLMFSEALGGNRSRNLTGDRPELPTSFKTWRNGSLSVPPGEYTFNLSIRDSDNRWLRTGYTDPNLTVEATPPRMADVKVGPETLEGGETVHFSLRTNDTRGIEKAWAVLNHTDRPPIRTDDFEEEPGVSDSGNGTYEGSHTFRFPGTYQVKLKVEDRPGNVATRSPCEVNASAPCTIKVKDLEKPTILESCIVTEDLCRSTKQGQEIGGSLTFLLRATDNHPRAPDVDLEVTLPTGAVRTLEPEKVAQNRWERTIEFGSQSQWPAGDYEAHWVITDPDGNVRRSPTPLPFLVEPRGPPRLVEVSPEHRGWGGATPQVSATVQDVNIDPDRIDVAVSVNGAPFESVQTSIHATSTKAFVSTTLGPFVHGDRIRVRVNATDTLGEFPANPPVWSFRVDDRDPQADLTFDGSALEGLARQVVPAATELAFTGSDGNESGLDRVEYRVAARGGTFSDWRAADGAVNLTRHPSYVGSGPYTVEYRAVDVAGNTGSSTSAAVYVDTEAPTVSYRRSPGHLQVTVEDPGAGVEEVRVFYRNQSRPFQRLTANLVQKTPDGGVYQVDLPFAPRGTPVQVYFAVTDALDHTREVGPPDTAGVRPISWQEPNHPPKVTIASPSPGSTVSGTVPVVWQASDPDGDDFRLSASARPVPIEEFQQFAEPAGNPGRAQWDTTSVADGRYIVRVSARDGTNTTHATTRVDVRNTELGLAGVGIPSDIEPGVETPISVTIYRDVSSVEATVTLATDGGSRAVATVPLRDDGRAPDEAAGDGTFSGTFTPKQEGAYSVSLDVTYDDGSAETMKAVGAFSAQTTFAEQLEANQDVVAAAGAILVVLAAATVVQLYRYGYI